MKKRFLDYFETELEYLYGAARSLGEKYPRNAARLGLDRISAQTADPFIKQLMEGVAFLTARLHSRMDDVHVEHARRLLEMVYPGLLAPIPSSMVICFLPQNSAFSATQTVKPVVIERGRVLRVGERDGSNKSGRDSSSNRSECNFTLTQLVELWPLTLYEVLLQSANEHRKSIVSNDSAATHTHVLSMSLTMPELFQADMLSMDSLPVYLTGPENSSAAVSRTLEAIITKSTSIRVFCDGQDVTASTSPYLMQMGLDDQERLMPNSDYIFSGDRLIREYFILRQKFHFIRFCNLNKSLRNCDKSVFAISIYLNLRDAVQLIRDVQDVKFKLFCSPATNLFKRDLVPLKPDVSRHEHHLLTDKINPNRYEIHSVVGVSARTPKRKIEYRPYYAYGSDHLEKVGFYSLKRVSSALLNSDVQLNQERYSGSEVYLTLVDNNGYFLNSDRSVLLDIGTLCTNRERPILIDRGLVFAELVEGSGYVQELEVEFGPSKPISAPRNESVLWSLVGLLTRNYRGISTDTAQSVEQLAFVRNLILLHAGQSDSNPDSSDSERSFALGVADSVRELVCTPSTYTYRDKGINVIARGLRITVKLDAEVFPGKSTYLFGALLSQYFSRQSSINSTTETVLCHSDGTEVFRWGPDKSKMTAN